MYTFNYPIPFSLNKSEEMKILQEGLQFSDQKIFCLKKDFLSMMKLNEFSLEGMNRLIDMPSPHPFYSKENW